MKRLVILAVLLVCQRGQADTDILVFDSYPSKEAKQVTKLFKRRVKPPIHCHYVPQARATKAAFTHNLLWLKTKAKKGDTVIIYVSAHGNAGENELLICASKGPAVPSSIIRKTTETLSCPSLVLIATGDSGMAINEPWHKAIVVCASSNHENSYTDGIAKAVCQDLRQARHGTMRQLAFDLLFRIESCSPRQHPVASIFPEGNAQLTK